MLSRNVLSLILNDRKHLHFKKHTYALNNYREYNQALKRRDKFDIRLSEEIIKYWQHDERVYGGIRLMF